MATNELSARGVHYNTLLEGLSISYRPYGMIGDQLCTVIPVKKESDAFIKWNLGDALRQYNTYRQDGTRANQLTTGFDKDNYSVEEYAIEFQITDRVRENQDAPLMLEMALTNQAQDVIKLDQERRVITLLTTAGNYANTNTVTLSGVNQWNNAAFSGNIEKVLDDAKEAVRINTANNAQQLFAVIPQAAALVVKRDAKVRDLIRFTDKSLLTNGGLPPEIWGMRIVVPTVVGNTSVTEIFGADTYTLADLWGKDIVLTFKGAPALNTFMHCAIFRHQDLRIEQWRDEPTSSSWYRASYRQAEKIISNVGGYLIHNVIA